MSFFLFYYSHWHKNQDLLLSLPVINGLAWLHCCGVCLSKNISSLLGGGESLMVNAPLFSQTRDMLRKCHCFQSRGTWQQYHSNGRWINSEGYMVHIKIGLDFPETVQITICYPWPWLVTVWLQKSIKRSKEGKNGFLNINLHDFVGVQCSFSNNTAQSVCFEV